MEQDVVDQLMEAAVKASKNAYAPYSNYKVGAAVLCDDGTIFQGCNVENASYGLTICAERVAIFNARVAGKKHFKALAIYAPQPPLPSPCGACRQVMAESGDPLIIIIKGKDSLIRQFTLKELLPHTFRLEE